MPHVATLIDALTSTRAQPALQALYGNDPHALHVQRQRMGALLQRAAATYPGRVDWQIYSSPGRTEVGGNHTDHNAGRVLAAAVDLDVIAAVTPNDSGIITIHSEGYPPSVIDTAQLAPASEERFTSAALVRGVAGRLQELGYRVGGFDACVASNVPTGSGLSSSAAFEVLVATILNHLYNEGRIDTITVARAAQYAENNYFGKPCGLMDQTTCAVGGFVTIDFRDFERPVVRKVTFDFGASGLAAVIVDTGGSHADLNDDYTALEHEMKSVARALGGRVLREFSKDAVLANLPALRKQVNDRAILRALHFYDDDQRVVEQAAALEANDLARFLNLIIASGNSSWMLCQNCYSCKDIEHQGISVALARSEEMLRGHGAWRVHGGGFAGTIQAFVPKERLAAYVEAMEHVFGPGTCHQLAIRSAGATPVVLA